MADLPPDVEVESMIEPYRGQMEAQMNEVLGTCAEQLFKEKPEGTLGNWLCDVIAEQAARVSGTPVDFAVQNYGGIRIGSLPQGPVTLGRVFEIMPFDNLVVILHMNGSELMEFLNHMAADDGWPVSGGLHYQIAGGKATYVTIGGEPLDNDRIYHFALPDFIANGGDNCFFLMEAPRTEMGYLVRDAIVDGVRELAKDGQEIRAQKEGRVTHAQ